MIHLNSYFMPAWLYFDLVTRSSGKWKNALQNIEVRTDELAAGHDKWQFLMHSKTPLNPNLRVLLLRDSKLALQLRIDLRV